jgi:hypothetical protein
MAKPNILLDLDQTLISAEKPGEYEKFREAIIKNTANIDEYPFLKDVKDMLEDEDDKNSQIAYKIVSRPGLQQFLTFLFDNFNVSVWTAATKDYCLFVTEHIVIAGNNNRKLDYIFFNYHGNVSTKLKKSGPKMLTLLWEDFKLPGYNKDNSVIIDDNPSVYSPQKENCIYIPEFNFSDPNCVKDNYLDFLKEQLIKVRDEYRAGNKINQLILNINKALKEKSGGKSDESKDESATAGFKRKGKGGRPKGSKNKKTKSK